MAIAQTDKLAVRDVQAFPTSFPVNPRDSVTIGVGRTVKRDAVVVKVTTEDGIIGWGEAHHGRCPGAVAHIVNTTLKTCVVGQDARRHWNLEAHVRPATRQSRYGSGRLPGDFRY